ncbi:MAG: hypothetical protein L0Z50_40295, partial [Verrucomicrobiales bacterium]|nr:hypothetical protein [Verrucomicrobiales bacterium]
SQLVTSSKDTDFRTGATRISNRRFFSAFAPPFTLGHKSKAVHRAYAKKARVELPSLESYERKIVPLPSATPANGSDATSSKPQLGQQSSA